MSALSFAAPSPKGRMADFKNYLENSLRNPFVLDLSGLSLMDVIRACANAKSRLHPNFPASIGCLKNNLKLLEEQYFVSLVPVQVTDIFWGYFVSFCQSRGIKLSSIETMCNQLRSILNWASKYNAKVSPTYTDIGIPKARVQTIALTADEVSHIAHFDIDRFYADKRSDFRETMKRVRDQFTLSCSLGQRHSDLVRIDPSCFERNIFSIVQQKTGNRAVVDIDKYAVDAKTTYRILERYGYLPPYPAYIGNYNERIHWLLRDVGIDEPVRIEERVCGKLVVETVPKWKLCSSHTGRRTFSTINVLRGVNLHDLKRATGHSDLRSLEQYIRDE